MTRAYADDLALAHVLADTADSIAMARFRALDLRVTSKPDLTPVSDADTAVEKALRGTLARTRPRDGVLGEEFGASVAAAGPSQRQWVIDPIDATKNYVRGVPIWATLVALMEGGEPVVGLVSAPALGRRWWAAKGLGAYAGRHTVAATAIPSPASAGWPTRLLLLLAGWLGAGRPARRGGRDHPPGMAQPRLRGLLRVHAGRRGRGRHHGRAGTVPLGPRRAGPDRHRGRRDVHRSGWRPAPAAAARSPPTANCTPRSSTGSST